MTSSGNDINDPTMKLSSYQIAFIDKYFDPECKRVILLGADTGLGKSTTLCALSWRLLKEKATARVLVLAPAILVPQFSHILNTFEVPSQQVDRYRFREMLDTSSGENFWPRGSVTVMSSDLAKKPDVLSSLTQIQWDLVIADESHSFGGARAELLRQVWSNASRMILSTLPNLEPPLEIPTEDICVVVWKREQFGTPFVAPPALREVAFSLSSSELELLETVGSLLRIFDDKKPQQNLLRRPLLRKLQSSPSALESALQRLKENLMTQSISGDAFPGFLTEELSDGNQGAIDDQLAAGAIVAIDGALEKLEDLRSDSKLDSFGGLLTALSDKNVSQRRICIVTEYISTLHYLAAEIEGRGMQYNLLHGSMGRDECQRSLALFANSGETLITTIMSVKGIEFRDVTDLILYDIPTSKVALHVVISRFSRSSGLNIHVFTPTNDVEYLSTESLDLLQEVIYSSQGKNVRT